MNNKLFARIAAAAVGVSMLATVAFAAPVATKDDTAQTGSLNFVVDGTDVSESKDEAQITMMAYLVDDVEYTTDNPIPAYTDQEIVALDQIEGGEGNGFGLVPLDYTKLASGKAIVVKLGGSDGSVDTYLVKYNAEKETIEIIVGDVNGDGKANATDGALIKMYAAKLTSTQKNNFNVTNESNVGEAVVDEDGAEHVVGDVNGDGKANATDGALINMYASKLTSTQKNNFNTTNESTVGATLVIVVE